jgi:hypothetical protein
MTIFNWRFWILAAVGPWVSVTALAQSNSQPTAPLQLCIDNVCSDVTIPSSSSAGIKWYPGHYVSIIPNLYTSTPSTLESILSFIDSIGNEPAIKGVQIFGYWGQFEGATAGDYSKGFATVDAILNRCGKYGKRLMFNVMPAYFGKYGSDWTSIFPAYLINSSGYGISQFTQGSGLQARIWQRATSDRLIALMKAYGARYDSHPLLEMVVLGETSVNLAVGTDEYSFSALDTELKRQMTATRAAFPNTAVRLGANWYFSDSNMSSLINHARSLQIAIGGPDVLPNEAIQANQVFSGATNGSTDYRGIIPFVSEVQSPELGGHEGIWTNEQLYLSAMKGVASTSGGATGSGSAVYRAVQPQYFVWYHNTWSGGAEQKWSTGTLPFIRKINGAVYSTVCPSGYTRGCRTN